MTTNSLHIITTSCSVLLSLNYLPLIVHSNYIFFPLAGGLDFVPINQILMFGPGEQRRCVSITILNDQECEDRPNEVFTVLIRGDDPRCVLQPSALTVTIDDIGLHSTLSDPDCCKFSGEAS